jgi:hypothetical protein
LVFGQLAGPGNVAAQIKHFRKDFVPDTKDNRQLKELKKANYC